MARQQHGFLLSPYPVAGPGVYALLNHRNGKIYIGSSICLGHRLAVHRNAISRNRANRYLLRAIAKEPHAFSVEVLEEMVGASKEKLLAREQFWMDFYRSYKPEHGYNIAPLAASCLGVKHSDQTRARVAEAARKAMTPERNRAMVNARLAARPHGWKWNSCQRLRHSEIHKGKRWTEQAKAKWRDSMQRNPLAFNRRPVVQMDRSGAVVGRFISVNAAERVFGKRSNIHAVCKGKRRSAFGYCWRYLNG